MVDFTYKFYMVVYKGNVKDKIGSDSLQFLLDLSSDGLKLGIYDSAIISQNYPQCWVS